jgi:NADPH2:quinone reductase
VLFHAAAGGVGLIACQWAKALGLQLIATAGSDAKCQLALANGAAHAINYSRRLCRAREGNHRWPGREGGVRLGGQGHLGQVAGLPAPLRPDGQLWQRLGPGAAVCSRPAGPKGSLYVTRQTLFTHIATRESTQAMADDLFAVVASGQVKIHIDQRYPWPTCSRRTATWKRARPPARPSSAMVTVASIGWQSGGFIDAAHRCE